MQNRGCKLGEKTTLSTAGVGTGAVRKLNPAFTHLNIRENPQKYLPRLEQGCQDLSSAHLGASLLRDFGVFPGFPMAVCPDGSFPPRVSAVFLFWAFSSNRREKKKNSKAAVTRAPGAALE